MLNAATIRRRRLMSSGASYSAYAVGENEPDVVADFESATEYFRVGGSDSDFETMFDLGTTTAYPTSLRTMVDSDGYVKWGPHNKCYPSEDFSTSWLNSGTTDTGGQSDPVGGSSAYYLEETATSGSHYIRRSLSGVVVGATYTVSVYMKAAQRTIGYLYSDLNSAQPAAKFNLSSGTVGTEDNSPNASIVDAGNGWYLCSIEITPTATSSAFSHLFGPAITDTAGVPSYSGSTGNGIYIYGAHLYRSDLGGMAPVPVDQRAAPGAEFATYVPTTTTARYLHRRGNYVYNGTSWVKKGILLETEARTNTIKTSIPNSTDWSTANRVSITANSTASPDGTTNASLILADGTSGSHYASIVVNPITSSVLQTYSVYLKYSDAQYVQIVTSTPANAYINIDLVGGSITTSGAGVTTSNLEELSGGWFRAIFTATPANTNNTLTIGIVSSGTAARLESNTLSTGVYAYGAQYEEGSTPSSYIPTSGATVTRAADALTIPAANMSYSATAMSFQINGTFTTYNKDVLVNNNFVRWFNNSNNYIRLYLESQFSRSRPVIESAESGTFDEVEGSNSFDFSIDDEFNLAVRITTSELNLADAGTALTANTTLSAIPTLSSNNYSLFYNDTNGNIGLFRQWDVDLGDSGIETAST